MINLLDSVSRDNKSKDARGCVILALSWNTEIISFWGVKILSVGAHLVVGYILFSFFKSSWWKESSQWQLTEFGKVLNGSGWWAACWTDNKRPGTSGRDPLACPSTADFFEAVSCPYMLYRLNWLYLPVPQAGSSLQKSKQRYLHSSSFSSVHVYDFVVKSL